MAISKVSKKITTPIGELKWIFTTGNGKQASEENPDDRVYTASLVLKKDSPEYKILVGKIDEVWQEFKTKNNLKPATKPKSLGYKPEQDEETGEDLDTVIFQFKTNVYWPDGTKTEIKHLGPTGEPMDMEKPAGNGSIGLIFGTAAGYEYKNTYGISLYLRGIQFAYFKPFTGSDVDASEVQDLSNLAAQYGAENVETPETVDSGNDRASVDDNTPPI